MKEWTTSRCIKVSFEENEVDSFSEPEHLPNHNKHQDIQRVEKYTKQIPQSTPKVSIISVPYKIIPLMMRQLHIPIYFKSLNSNTNHIWVHYLTITNISRNTICESREQSFFNQKARTFASTQKIQKKEKEKRRRRRIGKENAKSYIYKHTCEQQNNP